MSRLDPPIRLSYGPLLGSFHGLFPLPRGFHGRSASFSNLFSILLELLIGFMGSIALPPFPLPHTARGQFSIGRAPCLGIVPPGTPGGWSSPGVLFLGPLNPPLCPGFILAPFCARRRSRPLRPCSQRSRGSLAHDGLGRPFELRRGLSSRLAAGHTAPHPHTLACGCLRHVCRTSVSPVCSHSRWWFSMSIKNSNEITQNKNKKYLEFISSLSRLAAVRFPRYSRGVSY